MNDIVGGDERNRLINWARTITSFAYVRNWECDQGRSLAVEALTRTRHPETALSALKYAVNLTQKLVDQEASQLEVHRRTESERIRDLGPNKVQLKDWVMVPHSHLPGNEDCCGILMLQHNGIMARFECNECGAGYGPIPLEVIDPGEASPIFAPMEQPSSPDSERP